MATKCIKGKKCIKGTTKRGKVTRVPSKNVAKNQLIKKYAEFMEYSKKCHNNVIECIEETEMYSGGYHDDPYNDAIVDRILREADDWAKQRDMYKKKAVAVAKEYERRYSPEKFPYLYYINL